MFVQVLSLGANPIVHLPVSAFTALRHLRRFDMSNARLQRIDVGTFNSTPHIHSILLNNNQLKRYGRIHNRPYDQLFGPHYSIAPHTFADLTHLFTINLAGNNISSIAEHAFVNTTALAHVDLRCAHIFVRYVCYACRNNSLAELDRDIFDAQLDTNSSSTQLYLCGECLTCAHQQRLGNPWTCASPRNAWLLAWHSMDTCGTPCTDAHLTVCAAWGVGSGQHCAGVVAKSTRTWSIDACAGDCARAMAAQSIPFNHITVIRRRRLAILP
jgi:hypothetical protein